MSRTLIFPLAILFLLGLGPTPASAATCNTYSSGTTPPTGYAAAWNTQSSARELLVSVDCSVSTYTLSAGSATAPTNTQAVYATGYYWTGAQWQSYTLSPKTSSGTSNGYILGTAQKTNLPYVGATSYVVAFSCISVNGTWKCGCANSSCSPAMWNLQAAAKPSSGGGSTGGGTGGGSGTGTGEPIDFNTQDTSNLLLDKTNVPSVPLPSWNDAQGTVHVDYGNGTTRSMSWDSTGFVVAENGKIIEEYPPAFPLPRQDSPGKTYNISTQTDFNNIKNLSLKPGDSVLLQRGKTFTGALAITTSGTQNNVIKYGAYGSGNKPVIDGQNTVARIIDTKGKNHLWFDNLDIKRGQYSSSDGKATHGVGMFFVAPNAVNITLTSLVLRESQGNAIRINGGSNGMRIRGTLLHGNAAWALVITDGTGLLETRNFVFANNDVYDNARLYHEQTGTEHMVFTAETAYVYGNVFRDQGTGDHALYKNWYGHGTNASESGPRIFDNLFTKGNGVKSFSPLGIKGRGATAYRNRVDTTLQKGIGVSFGYSGSGAPNRNVSYVHHNDVKNVGPHPSGWPSGGITVGASAGAGGGTPSGTTDLTAWNNSITNSFAGFLTERQGDGTPQNTTLRIRNNLMTNVQECINNDIGLTPADNTANSCNGSNATAVDDVYLMNDPNSWIGINYVPHATSPDVGAVQHLTGKTLNFSKYFLGLKGSGGTASIKLWSTKKF